MEKKKILVVVDMQNDFIDGPLGTKEGQMIVDNVVDKINNFDGEIFVTYDTHFDNYMSTREGRYLPVPHCIKDTDGFELNKKVSNALIDRLHLKVYKPTFGSIQLVKYLYDLSEKRAEVTLIGVCTDICVLSNALLLKAHYPEMDIIVDASCCAGTTVEAHNAALLTMQSCQIDIINWEK